MKRKVKYFLYMEQIMENDYERAVARTRIDELNKEIAFLNKVYAGKHNFFCCADYTMKDVALVELQKVEQELNDKLGELKQLRASAGR